jgi:hypothetical protein
LRFEKGRKGEKGENIRESERERESASARKREEEERESEAFVESRTTPEKEKRNSKKLTKELAAPDEGAHRRGRHDGPCCGNGDFSRRRGGGDG